MNSYEQLSRKPTTKQMFDLAAGVMCLAKDQGKLRESSNPAKKAKLFVSEGIEKMRVDEPGYTLQRFIGSVNRYGNGQHRSWSMRLIERFWAVEYYAASEVVDGEERIKFADTISTTYKFEWNSDEVTKASRQIALKSEGKEETNNTYLSTGEDWRSGPIDPILAAPDIWHAANQVSIVSQADSTRLLRDVRNFSAACRTGSLAVLGQ